MFIRIQNLNLQGFVFIKFLECWAMPIHMFHEKYRYLYLISRKGLKRHPFNGTLKDIA
jgi:hypothetical protein